MSDADDIAEFIRRRGVTKCPPAAVAPTHGIMLASIPEAKIIAWHTGMSGRNKIAGQYRYGDRSKGRYK